MWVTKSLSSNLIYDYILSDWFEFDEKQKYFNQVIISKVEHTHTRKKNIA